MDDLRHREAQLAVLSVLGKSKEFREVFVLKGAMQVEAITQMSRSTRDLDLESRCQALPIIDWPAPAGPGSAVGMPRPSVGSVKNLSHFRRDPPSQMVQIARIRPAQTVLSGTQNRMFVPGSGTTFGFGVRRPGARSPASLDRTRSVVARAVGMHLGPQLAQLPRNQEAPS